MLIDNALFLVEMAGKSSTDSNLFSFKGRVMSSFLWL